MVVIKLAVMVVQAAVVMVLFLRRVVVKLVKQTLEVAVAVALTHPQLQALVVLV